jgi:glutathione S-transferase
MQLLYSPFSPFARKVRIAAFEIGLQDRIEVVPMSTEDPASGLSGHNPLNKIPVLETEIGPLYDSPVICEYLDALHDGPKLFPAPGPDRWRALRWQALADGLQDAALLIRYEASLRPEERQHPPYVERQKAKILRALARMEADVAELDGPVTIGQVAVAAGLGYLDLRFADWRWRDGHPKLAAWHAVFAARPSYATTEVKA